MAIAVRKNDGNFLAGAPRPVFDTKNMLYAIKETAGDTGTLLVGYDFPIGLPFKYCQRAGLTEYKDAISVLGSGKWVDFFHPATVPDEIDIYRPFYPMYPGGTSRDHLVEGLQIPFNELYRDCEKARPGRRAACPLFWTLGGQQVGKAAISGWREIIQPGISDRDIQLSIWPFSGHLDVLLQPGAVILAETYPAEFYTHLDIKFTPARRGQKSGKRSQKDRMKNAETLISCFRKSSISMEESLESLIRDGFGASVSGEDKFDAIVGLIGMIITLRNWGSELEPQAEHLRHNEGWILGMPVDHQQITETALS